MEIMVALVIVGVLATIGVPAYQNFVEDGRSRMCETNLMALKSAFDVYIVEHNVVPGDLGQIPAADIETALARARSKADWQEKVVRFIDERREDGYAFASLVQELSKGNLQLLYCPSDTRRKDPSAAKDLVSYGINEELKASSQEQYQDLSLTTPVIGDCDHASFEGDTATPSAAKTMTIRHKYIQGLSVKRYANYITVGGWVQSTNPAAAEKTVLAVEVPKVEAAAVAWKVEQKKENPNPFDLQKLFNAYMRELDHVRKAFHHHHRRH